MGRIDGGYVKTRKKTDKKERKKELVYAASHEICYLVLRLELFRVAGKYKGRLLYEVSLKPRL